MQGIVMSDKNDGRASRDANSLIENAKSLQRVAPLREGPQPRYGSPDRRRPWPGMVGGEYWSGPVFVDS